MHDQLTRAPEGPGGPPAGGTAQRGGSVPPVGFEDPAASNPGGPAGSDAGAGSGRGQHISVAWAGSPWELVGLSIVNFLLSAITLGIYSFWGRTEVRRRIWSSIRLDGEPLAYTGTGKELFLGFLFAMLVVFLPIYLLLIAVVVWAGPESTITAVAQIAVTLGFFALMGIAAYRARRYRLTRTEWRGIRGGMSGVPSHYSWHWIWTGLLIGPTLGWIIPWRANRLQAHLTRETTFGQRNFAYEGTSSGLYGPFAVLWIGGLLLYAGVVGAIALIVGTDAAAAAQRGRPFQPSPGQIVAIIAIVTFAFTLLSVFGAWYRSRTLNLFAGYTGFETARLRLATTTWGLVGLVLTNFLITFFSLGILSAVTQARVARYITDRTSIEGTVDVVAIQQSQAGLGRGGEGLAQVLDVDAF